VLNTDINPTTGTSTTFTARRIGTAVITPTLGLLTPVSSGTLTVVAGPLDSLILDGPESATAGEPFSVTLTGSDIAGNPIVDDDYDVVFDGAATAIDGTPPEVNGAPQFGVPVPLDFVDGVAAASIMLPKATINEDENILLA